MFQRNIFSIAVVLMIISVALYLLYPAVKSQPARENDIEGADFFYTSADGNSYTVKADYVMKIASDRYKLVNVSGSYYLDASKKNYIGLSAEIALFNEEKNLMDLRGKVELTSSEGYKSTSDSMYLDLNQKTAHTDDKVTLSGAQGTTVSEKGMIIYMGAKKILLYGPITSVFASNSSQAPIRASAKTVEANYGSNVITYHDNVSVHQANRLDLYCDKATIFYALQPGARQGQYAIKQIQFFDKVTVVKGQKTAIGDFGVLYPQKKVMILRGNVALKEKDAYLEGQEVYYNTSSGIFTVHKAKPIENGSSKQDRIRVILGSEK